MEKSKNLLSIQAECEDCKNNFTVNANNLVYQKEFYDIEFGNQIFLTYYDCPKCGRRHFVQVDDTSTINLSVRTKGQFKKMAKKQINTGKVTQNQNESLKYVREQTRLGRENLMQCYQGREVKDKDGNSYELRFSV